MEIKFLNFGFEIKGLDDTGIIEGYASTFNNIDQGFDMVTPGAFKKSLKESKGKFPILASHDPSKQIGWNLEAEEDKTGLHVKGKLDIQNNQLAREHFSLIKTAQEIKAKAGLSIGYMPVRFDFDETDEKVRYRKLKEVRLFEYSPVAFPMNTEASVTSAKSWLTEMTELLGEESVDENQLLKVFIAKLEKKGFNVNQVHKALVTAAAELNTPDDIVHLFDQGLKNLKSKLG